MQTQSDYDNERRLGKAPSEGSFAMHVAVFGFYRLTSAEPQFCRGPRVRAPHRSAWSVLQNALHVDEFTCTDEIGEISRLKLNSF